MNHHYAREENCTKVAVIGAGPVGSWAALNALKAIKAHDCTVFEMEAHKTGRRPSHCAGLVSKRLSTIVQVPERCIVNRVRGAVFSCGKNQTTILGHDKFEAFVLDRPAFDEHILNLATDAGAKLILGRKITHPVEELKEFDTIIAADGAASASRTSLGIKPPRMIPAFQKVIRLKKKGSIEDPSLVELHFENGSEFFAWIIPEDDRTVRAGIAASSDLLRAHAAFIRKRKIDSGRVMEKSAGLIVTGGPLKKTVFGNNNNRVLLAGDAAGQVKATTGGGVVTGMICGSIAGKCANNPVLYENAWRKEVGKELETALLVRNFLALKQGRPDFYEKAVRFLEQNKKLVETCGDMDFHSRLVLEILLRPGNWPGIAGMLLA